MKLSDFLKTIILEFIEDTENLTITETEEDNTILITVVPANKSDVAKIIGKKGRTISALRIIMRSICNAKNSDSEEPKKLRITVTE